MLSVFLIDDVTKVTEGNRDQPGNPSYRQASIFIGIALSFGLMTIAAFGTIPPAAGAMLQVISVYRDVLRIR